MVTFTKVLTISPIEFAPPSFSFIPRSPFLEQPQQVSFLHFQQDEFIQMALLVWLSLLRSRRQQYFRARRIWIFWDFRVEKFYNPKKCSKKKSKLSFVWKKIILPSNFSEILCARRQCNIGLKVLREMSLNEEFNTQSNYQSKLPTV
jgi:hypothetical protein